LLDSLLESENIGQSSYSDEIELDDDIDSGYGWMIHLLQSTIFSNISPESIQEIFVLSEEVAVSKDDVIIKQGALGDYYYIIKDGEFEVTRHTKENSKILKLATLHDGDCFGEGALLAEIPRSAGVIAITNGALIRITKEIFLRLICDPTINAVNYNQALQLVNDGATWIDVRSPGEHKQFAVADSLNLPLDMIRVQMKKLSPESNYIVFCDNGTRSAIATYILLYHGYTVSYLKDGINDHLEQPIIESESPVVPDTGVIAQDLLSQRSDGEGLPKALSTVMANLYKQLEQALKGKAEAEIARNIAEQKLDFIQKQKK
jgi:rhodanese-related sulfurtransferase